MANNSKTTGDKDHVIGGVMGRKLECCVGEHLKRNCPKRSEEKQENKKDDSGADNKHAEVKGRQLNIMFTSSVDVLSGIYFSEIVEDNKFTCHQFHVEGWGAQECEVHVPVAMHNATGHAVPLTWILLDSQSTVDLIANPKVLVTIRKLWDKDAISVHCNSTVKIVDRVGDLPGYGNVLYEPTGIDNIEKMLSIPVGSYKTFL